MFPKLEMVLDPLPRDLLDCWVVNLINLGTTYHDYDEEEALNRENAIQCFQQAIDIIQNRMGGDSEHLGTAWYNLGNTTRIRTQGTIHENLQKAVEYYENAQNICGVKNPDLLPKIFLGLARVMRKLASFQNASECLARCQSYCQWVLGATTVASAPKERALAHTIMASALENSGSSDTTSETYAATIRHLHEALNIYEQHPELDKERLDALGCLMTLYLRPDRNSQHVTQAHVEKMIELGRVIDRIPVNQRCRNNKADCLTSLAQAYAQRDQGDQATNMEIAIQFINQAVELLKPVSNVSNYMYAQFQRGCMHYKRVKGSKAENLEVAFECLKEGRKPRPTH